MKQIFWAGFGEEIYTLLISLNRDPTAPNNSITAKVIYNLYKEMLPELMRDADCHAALIVVNELVFKRLCSYRRENQAWRGRGNKTCVAFLCPLA